MRPRSPLGAARSGPTKKAVRNESNRADRMCRLPASDVGGPIYFGRFADRSPSCSQVLTISLWTAARRPSRGKQSVIPSEAKDLSWFRSLTEHIPRRSAPRDDKEIPLVEIVRALAVARIRRRETLA